MKTLKINSIRATLDRPFRLKLPSGAVLELPAGTELEEAPGAPAVEAVNVAALDPGKVYLVNITLSERACEDDYKGARAQVDAIGEELLRFGIDNLVNVMPFGTRLAINTVEPGGEFAHAMERLDALAEYVRVGLAALRRHANADWTMDTKTTEEIKAAERRAFPLPTVTPKAGDPR